MDLLIKSRIFLSIAILKFGFSSNPKAPLGFIDFLDSISLTFQSYSSAIAKITFDHHGTKTVLDKNYWDYSVTTGKYRNLFLNETKKETEAKIKSGEYKLKDLN